MARTALDRFTTGNYGEQVEAVLKANVDACNANATELYAAVATSGAANKVFATPDNAPGLPSLRALVWRDLPDLGGPVANVSASNTSGTPDTSGVVFIDASGGNITRYLPAASTAGRLVRYVRVDTSLNVVSLACQAGDTFADGSSSMTLPNVGSTVTAISNGVTTWGAF